MQEKSEETTSLLPRGELAVIKGGIHATNYDSPAALAQVIGSFLDRVCLPVPSILPVPEGEPPKTE